MARMMAGDREADVERLGRRKKMGGGRCEGVAGLQVSSPALRHSRKWGGFLEGKTSDVRMGAGVQATERVRVEFVG